MIYKKPELTTEQLEFLNELIKLANIGCPKEISYLNEHQSKVIIELQSLGYVRVYKGRQNFMVLMPP